MVVQSAKEAVDNAKKYTTCDPGYCLKYTRTWLEIPSRDSSASVAWGNALGKHAGDRTPPRGAPVFWTGGSKGYGHIGLNLQDNGSGSFRGTDMPSSGKVSNQAISWIENHWGLKYVGWAEGFNGVWIPYLKSGGGSGGGGSSGKVDPDKVYAKGDVYVSKLKKGQKESDSVSRLRYRLQNHKDIPANRKPGYGDLDGKGANYTEDVVSASKYWMQQIWKESHGTGENWTNKQANTIFGDNYTVHNE